MATIGSTCWTASSSATCLPRRHPALKKEDRELMTAWIAQGHRQAALAKNQAPHFRRLTRREYERTMQDLLGLPIEFGARLPEDGRSKDGFRNDGDALRMSPLQYETYLQIADEALAEAIVTGPPPVVHRYRITVDKFRGRGRCPSRRTAPENRSITPAMRSTSRTSAPSSASSRRRTPTQAAPQPVPARRPAAVGDRAFQRGGRAGCPGTASPSACIRRSARARPVIKVRAARVEPAEGADASRVPILTVAIGSTNFHGVELKTVGEPIVIDHTDFRTYEIRVRMENVSVPNTGPLNDRNSTILAAWNSAKVIEGESPPPLLKIEWIEFESPYFETWPPKTHTDILFANDGLDEKAYAREVLRRFATRAYRGPLAPAELDRLVNYWTMARENTDSLEASLRETLGVVLSSPRFLGLPASRTGGAKEKLTDHELASRLSYFLWSTMPDETLLRLADEGKLHEPAVLSAQVRRMIQDRRAWSFIEQFAEQWLELDRLQRVVVHQGQLPRLRRSSSRRPCGWRRSTSSARCCAAT